LCAQYFLVHLDHFICTGTTESVSPKGEGHKQPRTKRYVLLNEVFRASCSEQTRMRSTRNEAPSCNATAERFSAQQTEAENRLQHQQIMQQKSRTFTEKD